MQQPAQRNAGRDRMSLFRGQKGTACVKHGCQNEEVYLHGSSLHHVARATSLRIRSAHVHWATTQQSISNRSATTQQSLGVAAAAKLIFLELVVQSFLG